MVVAVLSTPNAMSEYEREVQAYCDHLNELLADYQSDELSSYLPLCPVTLLPSLRDGVLLSYILNCLFPGCIRLDQLVRGIDMETEGDQGNQKAIFEATANLNRALEAAKSQKGLVVVNIGSEDLLEQNGDLVLGLLWQLIRSQLLDQVNIVSHPELIRLLQPEESLAVLASLRPEPLLLRWFNYHLERVGSSLRLSSFSRDISDGQAYLELMAAISDDNRRFDTSQVTGDKCEAVLVWAKVLLGQSTLLIKAEDIRSGHPRLNLAFVATLFNSHIGIHLPSEDEIRSLHSQISQLKEEKASLQGELDSKSDRDALAKEIGELRAQVEAMKLAHEKDLEDRQAEYSNFKEALLAEYQESLDGAVLTERRQNQQELGEVRAALKEARRRVLIQIADMKGAIGEGQLDGTKAGESLKGLCEETSPLEQLLQVLSCLGHLLAEKSAKQARQLDRLQQDLAKKEKIEAIMAAKIKEYSEQKIQQAASAHPRKADEPREPAFSRFRTKTLPAIKRMFSCQGH